MYLLVLCTLLLVELDPTQASRKILRYLVRDKAFDARDLVAPSAVAPIVPIIPVPQYQPADPPIPPEVINPVPLVMYDGISPYSSLPGSSYPRLSVPSNQLPLVLFLSEKNRR